LDQRTALGLRASPIEKLGPVRHLIEGLVRGQEWRRSDKSGGSPMAARVGMTIAAALLALIAFLGGGPTAGGLLDPFGLFWVFLAVLIWFAWDKVVRGYASSKGGGDGAELPLLARFGPVFITGITNNLRRSSQRPPARSDTAAK
jgi:hypothetical protein